VDESSYRAELDALPTKEVYLRARRRAVRRLDVRFFWTLLRSIPAAEAAAGEVEEAQADVRSGIARLNDLRHAGEGKLGEALRPLYIDYLAKHAPKRPLSSGWSGPARSASPSHLWVANGGGRPCEPARDRL